MYLSIIITNLFRNPRVDDPDLNVCRQKSLTDADNDATSHCWLASRRFNVLLLARGQIHLKIKKPWNFFVFFLSPLTSTSETASSTNAFL